MKVGVVGTGHVGLVTCVTMAAIGHHVVGMDADAEKMEQLGRGVTPFFEPGLQELLERTTAEGTLEFSSDAEAAVAGAEVVFICVGTPARASGEANLIAVEQAAQTVARHATGSCAVVEKSTVPAGTAQRVRRTLLRERPNAGGDLEVVSNPEFLREGTAVYDSLNPERVLVGAESEWAFEVMRRLYAPITDKGSRLIETNISTAELAKHACNAFLALKISYANALARMCEKADADVVAVADVMGTDPRIGREFLHAGLGYGGYCFPKDLVAFERLSERLGYGFPLLREVARINDDAVAATINKIREALWNLEDKRIALLGLSFKAGTDDVRFSPSLALARGLIQEGAHVVGYDPQAAANAKAEVPELDLAPDAYDAAASAHCLVIGTEWDEFRALDLARIKEAMVYPVIIDGRNLLDPSVMRAAGFTYYPTGRPPVV
ncbi:MAG: UDP-glucose/GDP-mannose dehydrogenase family protein [Actinomycetota bacterium]